MDKSGYHDFWFAFVQLTAKDGFAFTDLIDFEGSDARPNYTGAWANIIVRAQHIGDAFDIIKLGLAELNFEAVFIDKIENINSLIEYDELKENVLAEVDWLSKSQYVFMISDKLFPYE